MRIRLGVDSDLPTDTMAQAIDSALEATTVTQVPAIESGRVPDIRDAIKGGRVKWQPEPPGDEHFDDARTCLARGWGDCDDLAPWLAASLRASGEAPDARAFVYQSGPQRWHAVVDRGDGKVLDPSKWAGMGRRGAVQGIGAATWAPMWPGKLALATYPYHRGWAGRVDLPDSDMPVSWSAVTYGPSRAHAVRAGAHGAMRAADIAGAPYEDDILRLSGLEVMLAPPDMVSGDVEGDLEELLETYGVEGVEELLPAVHAFAPEVGSLFGKVFKAVKKVASPIAKIATPLVSKGLQFIPGVGPVASTAFDVARSAMSKDGGGGGGAAPPPPHRITAPTAAAVQAMGRRPGTVMSSPGGVVIVKF